MPILLGFQLPKAKPGRQGTNPNKVHQFFCRVPWSPCTNEQIIERLLYLGRDRAGYGKFNINVHLGGLVLEVDGGEVLVVRFGQIEGELVVDGQVVCKDNLQFRSSLSPRDIFEWKINSQKHDSFTGSP